MEERYPNNRPVLINDGERKFCIDLNAVAFVMASHNYCNLFSYQGKLICSVRQTLDFMNKVLPERMFCKVNRSCIINVWHVELIIGRTVYMRGGKDVVVSDSCKDDFEKRFVVLAQNHSSQG